MDKFSVKILGFLDKNSPCKLSVLEEKFQFTTSNFSYFHDLCDGNMIDGWETSRGEYHIVITPTGKDKLQKYYMERIKFIFSVIAVIITLVTAIIKLFE